MPSYLNIDWNTFYDKKVNAEFLDNSERLESVNGQIKTSNIFQVGGKIEILNNFRLC